MGKLKKRGAVYGVIALMLAVAVYLNWSYVDTPEDLLAAGQITDKASASSSSKTPNEAASSAAQTAGTTETVSASDYFAQSRLSREKARDEALSILKETLADNASDAKSKELAAAQISRMADESVAEAKIESLMKAKGYREAVVFLGSDSASIIVATPQAGFTETDASKIRDIVVSETSLRADQIKIVEAA